MVEKKFDGRPFFISERNMPQWKLPIDGHRFGSRWDKIQCDIVVTSLRKDWGFLDIGASFGTFAFLAVTRTERIVTTFEPDPHNCEVLRANLKEYSNTLTFGSALSDETGFGWLQQTEDQCGGHVARSYQSEEQLRITCLTLDPLQIQADMIKVDVEGTANRVLCGGAQTFRRAKIVLLEIHERDTFTKQPTREWDAVKLLLDWGFTYNLFKFEGGNPGVVAFKNVDDPTERIDQTLLEDNK